MLEAIFMAVLLGLVTGLPALLVWGKHRRDAGFAKGDVVTFILSPEAPASLRVRQCGVITNIFHRSHGVSPVFEVTYYPHYKATSTECRVNLSSEYMTPGIQ